MITIISPTTANSNLVHGVFYNGQNFVNKYNDQLKDTWVVFCYWSNENSKHGLNVANLRTEFFCSKYNLENKKY
jgi:hypothetical protein